MGARRFLFRSVHRELGGHLQFLASGGAFLDPSLAQKWENLGTPVLQGYGATEATALVTGNSLRHRRLGTVGRVEVHAVVWAADPEGVEKAVRETNHLLAPHQQIRGFTVWPGEDLPHPHP